MMNIIKQIMPLTFSALSFVCFGQTTIRVQDQFLEVIATENDDTLYVSLKNISNYSSKESAVYIQWNRFQQNPSTRSIDGPVRIKNYSTPGHTPVHLSCIEPDSAVNAIIPLNDTSYCLDLVYAVGNELASIDKNSLVIDSWSYLTNGRPLVVCSH